MNRRDFLKKTTIGLLSFIGLSSASYYYAKIVEPSLLDITEHTYSSGRVPQTFNNIKIIQFSDTHLGFHYTLKQLKELVLEVNSLQPDLILFTGDLIDKPRSYKSRKKLIDILKQFEAPLGKFWIYGNHDHGDYGTNLIENIMNKSNFVLLKNSHEYITIGNEKIIIAGVDDAILGKPDLSTTLLNTDPKLFTILLAHEPDFADTALNYPVDIQLSGHSHGGQVNLPILGPLYTPVLAKKYVKGIYTFVDKDLFLYVNRGIGTTRLPFRFLCKPEILSLTISTDQT